MSDNRATRAHIAASRGYRHDHLSTDELLADETADALMGAVAGRPKPFDTGRVHEPLRVPHAVRGWRDPWSSDPDRTTRHWRPETAA
jgi:hypothetical protein